MAQAEVQRLRNKLAATVDPIATQEVATEQMPVSEPSRQQQAAEMRHAEEPLERVEQALERMPEMEAKIKPDEEKEARVSTTAPQATVMKMADGGDRPAYNVEYRTTCHGQVIVGVDVVTVGSDQGPLPPRLDLIEDRFKQRPKEGLVDGGFVNWKEIEKVQGGKKCQVDAPVVKPKKEGIDRHEPKATDGEEVAEWHKRMGMSEAKKIYQERAAMAECVDAQARNRSLQQFVVRGIDKVKSIASWFALQPQLVVNDCS